MSRGGDRLGGIAGIAFAAAFVLLFVIHPDSGETNAEIVAYYEDSGNRTLEYVSSALAVLGALALVVFTAALATRLAAATGAPDVWSRLALAGGVLGATLLVVGRAVSLGVVFAGDDEAFVLDPDLARVVESAGFLLIMASVMALSLVALAVVTVGRRTGIFPAWLVWSSLAMAVLALAAVTFLPIFLALAWVVAVSATLLRPGLSRSRG